MARTSKRAGDDFIEGPAGARSWLVRPFKPGVPLAAAQKPTLS